jgi:hypothetical protein
METVEAGAILRGQGICTHTFDIVRTGHALEFVSADEHLKAVQRVAELEAALREIAESGVQTWTTLTARDALKGQHLDN